jgi:hypothetical protein
VGHLKNKLTPGAGTLANVNDPLSAALNEASTASTHAAPSFVDQHTAHPRGVHDILEVVSKQVLSALALPFFDGEGWSEVTPVVKAGIAEAGTVHVSARHLEPPCRADITLDVRTDLESPVDARYQIRGRCEISCGERGTASLRSA